MASTLGVQDRAVSAVASGEIGQLDRQCNHRGLKPKQTLIQRRHSMETGKARQLTRKIATYKGRLQPGSGWNDSGDGTTSVESSDMKVKGVQTARRVRCQMPRWAMLTMDESAHDCVLISIDDLYSSETGVLVKQDDDQHMDHRQTRWGQACVDPVGGIHYLAGNSETA